MRIRSAPCSQSRGTRSTQCSIACGATSSPAGFVISLVNQIPFVSTQDTISPDPKPAESDFIPLHVGWYVHRRSRLRQLLEGSFRWLEVPASWGPNQRRLLRLSLFERRLLRLLPFVLHVDDQLRVLPNVQGEPSRAELHATGFCCCQCHLCSVADARASPSATAARM